MRLTEQLLKKARAPQNIHKVPFKPTVSMALKNRVGATRMKAEVSDCTDQMCSLLLCLGENNYNNSNCTAEVSELQECFNNYNQGILRQKLLKTTEIPIPGVKQMSAKQIGYLLNKFPNV